MMNKGIKQVRKSIMKRKKSREIQPEYVRNTSITTKQMIPTLPQEEEKHGYLSTFPEDISGKNDITPTPVLAKFIMKGILSIILFFSIGILFKSESVRLETLKSWTSHVLQEDFPFAKVNQWYQETFGRPFVFSPHSKSEIDHDLALALPVSGDITESFQANGKGILIAPDKTANVTALQEGIVVFAGNKRETEKTVIIQHADGSKTTYGYLSSIDVHIYQSIQADQQLGQFNPSEQNETVYFSIEKNNKYIDPVQVIKVDDQS